MTTADEKAIRQELSEVESYLAQLTERMQRVNGYRDTLVRKLCDMEGAHSSRFVAAR